MEFDDMQAIWQQQKSEAQYAIDLDALHGRIRRKSQAFDQKLSLIERLLIGANLAVGVLLVALALAEGDDPGQAAIGGLYIFYGFVMAFRRRRRQTAELDFARSVRGQLDKAIWQTEYLIRQSRSIIVWYLLPIMGAFLLLMGSGGKWGWAIGFVLVVVPLTIVGARWEVNRWYLPKQRELKALREELVAIDDAPGSLTDTR